MALNAARLRQDAAEAARHHRQRTLRQIAEIVGKIGIDPVDDGFVAVIAVLAERHFTQKEVTQRIDAIGVDQRKRIDDIADRLRHFLAAVEQKPV